MGSSVPHVAQQTPVDRWCIRHRRVLLGAVLVLAAVLRVVYFAQLQGTTAMEQQKWSQTDMNFFDTWGRHLASGDWAQRVALHPHHGWHRDTALLAMGRDPALRAAMEAEQAARGDDVPRDQLLWDHWYGGVRYHQEPLYAYLIALTYRVLDDPRLVYAWQMLVGLGTLLLLAAATRRAFGEAAGLAAALLGALCAPLLFYELVLLRATLLAAAGMGLAVLAGRAVDKRTFGSHLLFGLAAGAALLLKTTWIVYLFGALAVFAWRRRPSTDEPRPGTGAHATSRVAGIAAVVLGVACALAPVVARNVSVGAPPVSLSSVAAPTIAMSLGPHATASKTGQDLNYDDMVRVMLASDGRAWPALVASLALHESALHVLHLLQLRAGNVLNWYEAPQNVNLLAYALDAPVLGWLPVGMLLAAPLGLLGLLLARERWRRAWPLLLLLVATMTPLIVLSTVARYRLPFLVALLPFAGLACARLAGWVVARRPAPALASLAAAGLVALFVARPLPPDEYPIRAHDRIQPYNFHYRPLVTDAVEAGDWPAARALLDEYLRHDVPEIEQLDEEHPPATYHEAMLAAHYARVWRLHAQVLLALGDERGAARSQARGDALAASVGLDERAATGA